MQYVRKCLYYTDFLFVCQQICTKSSIFGEGRMLMVFHARPLARFGCVRIFGRMTRPWYTANHQPSQFAGFFHHILFWLFIGWPDESGFFVVIGGPYLRDRDKCRALNKVSTSAAHAFASPRAHSGVCSLWAYGASTSVEKTRRK